MPFSWYFNLYHSFFLQQLQKIPYYSATVACPIWLQLYPATAKTLLVTSRSQRPPALLATATTQQTSLSMENVAKRLSFTKPWSHLMAPPNIISGAPKRYSRPFGTITPTPSDIERKKNATELSKAFWNAKDSGHQPIIKWSIADWATAYQPGSWSCNLCLTEKLEILVADEQTALNERFFSSLPAFL